MASSRRGFFPKVPGDELAFAVFGTSAGLWTALFMWSSSPFSIYLGHGQLESVSSLIGFIPLLLLFLVGWSVMVLAMMLPATFPLVSELRRRAHGHSTDRKTAVLTVAGSIGVWVPFGIAAYLMDFGIHWAARLPPLLGNVWILGFSSLALAGLYQLTPKKSSFLTDCCGLGEFLQSQKNEVGFRTGLSFGKRSVGSHWAMMLLMFSLGVQSFPLMLLVGTAMIAEHDAKLGPRVRVPIGLAILALAFLFVIINVKI